MGKSSTKTYTCMPSSPRFLCPPWLASCLHVHLQRQINVYSVKMSCCFYTKLHSGRDFIRWFTLLDKFSFHVKLSSQFYITNCQAQLPLSKLTMFINMRGKFSQDDLFTWNKISICKRKTYFIQLSGVKNMCNSSPFRRLQLA